MECETPAYNYVPTTSPTVTDLSPGWLQNIGDGGPGRGNGGVEERILHLKGVRRVARAGGVRMQDRRP